MNKIHRLKRGGQPFQTNRLLRKSSGWAVEICLFHLLSVWNHHNFHVNGKQPVGLVDSDQFTTVNSSHSPCFATHAQNLQKSRHCTFQKS
jgi:hypothetical protein